MALAKDQESVETFFTNRPHPVTVGKSVQSVNSRVSSRSASYSFPLRNQRSAQSLQQCRS
ncbi:MAG: hypothetical protein AVDCRST_MAG26-2695 [uncultured Chloroflexia bacterium]|uniref:Uncharacterized protein n=1 Tax=uncultured Chloroflexia bacterium TaxID=1672391 RepID=A0A6J4J525_9CHLR|nr:MAG: hypothetical protein AVDCRST_MAG26-2695 [uncultured Chloroflexia bacterium]